MPDVPVSHGLLRDRRGISAMEFAFVAPVLVVLMLGAFDLGSAAFQYIELDQVVRSGGQYALSHPADTAGIVNVASAAATDSSLSGVQIEQPTYFCSCDPAGTARPAPVDCTSSPASCSVTDQFVQLKASEAYSYFLFNASNLPGPKVGAAYVARFQ